MVLQGAVKASLVANSFVFVFIYAAIWLAVTICVGVYCRRHHGTGHSLGGGCSPTNAPIIHGRVWHVQVAFSAHPNTNGGVHPIFCSFIHFMNLKVDSIDWLIDWRFACISEWLIEFNFDWLIYWILLLIDLLIDWLNWHLLIDLNWHLVTFVHLRLPSAQFTQFGSSQLIDWLLWGAALR